jgi:hypothetical protein
VTMASHQLQRNAAAAIAVGVLATFIASVMSERFQKLPALKDLMRRKMGRSNQIICSGESNQ